MPKLFSCPSCGYTRSWVIRRHHRKCKKCRKEWSPKNIHAVSGFRLSRREWSSIINTFLRDGTIGSIENRCNLAHGTASKAALAIRIGMTNDVPNILMGICEADETYVGGAWRNKAVHIRKQGAKRGRGTSKQAIFGVIQRENDFNALHSYVRVWLVPNTKNASLIPHIQETVCRGSTIYTDGRKGYRHLPRYGYLHDWVDHDAGEYVRGNVHTQSIDGYWGLLKNHLAKTGGIRKKYLAFFIGEHVWRFNFRHLNIKEKTKRIYQNLHKFGGS